MIPQLFSACQNIVWYRTV